jgi:hypothetical protein
MNTSLKKTMIAIAIAAVLAPASAYAQKSGGGVMGGARQHPGTWQMDGSASRSRSYSRSYTRSYRSSPRVIVRSERAPAAVAQAPTERRSFSYDPATPKASSRVTTGRCGEVIVSKSDAKASSEKSATTTRRSYSYEPSMTAPPAARQRVYNSGPRRGSTSSAWRSQMGSKDARNNPHN